VVAWEGKMFREVVEGYMGMIEQGMSILGGSKREQE
jgi:hypothetical protein